MHIVAMAQLEKVRFVLICVNGNVSRDIDASSTGRFHANENRTDHLDSRTDFCHSDEESIGLTRLQCIAKHG